MEQLRVTAGSDEIDRTPWLRRIINLIDEKEISADMAFAMIRPCASQSSSANISSALANRAVPRLIISSDSAIALWVSAFGTLSSRGKA